jgi:hypothetical protein
MAVAVPPMLEKMTFAISTRTGSAKRDQNFGLLTYCSVLQTEIDN